MQSQQRYFKPAIRANWCAELAKYFDIVLYDVRQKNKGLQKGINTLNNKLNELNEFIVGLRENIKTNLINSTAYLTLCRATFAKIISMLNGKLLILNKIESNDILNATIARIEQSYAAFIAASFDIFDQEAPLKIKQQSIPSSVVLGQSNQSKLTIHTGSTQQDFTETKTASSNKCYAPNVPTTAGEKNYNTFK